MWHCLVCNADRASNVCVGCCGFQSGLNSRMNPDGSSYNGEWLNGLYHGTGTRVDQKGGVYQGTFCLGVRQGTGIHTAADGVVYSGEWHQDLPNGSGVLAMEMGDIKFRGTFSDGALHGFVEMCKVDRSVEKGFWINGKREGLFYLDRNDSTSWLSTWRDGEICGAWLMVRAQQKYLHQNFEDPKKVINQELASVLVGIERLVSLRNTTMSI